eukprot:2512978-Rhodomonas_salina.1
MHSGTLSGGGLRSHLLGGWGGRRRGEKKEFGEIAKREEGRAATRIGDTTVRGPCDEGARRRSLCRQDEGPEKKEASRTELGCGGI